MTGHSITRRLVAWLALSTILFWTTAAILGAYVMHDEFGEIFDSSMRETAARLLPLAVDDVRKGDLPDSPPHVGTTDGDGYLTYQVRDKNGVVLMHSYATPPAPFKAPLVEGFWQGDGMRVFTSGTRDGAVVVQVADSLAHRAEAIQDSVLALSLPLVLLVPLSVVVLLFIVRREMSPLADLRTTIAEKDSGNLSHVETAALPIELAPIAASLNLVLSRLSVALTAEREFASNSAHELRTPIAGALAQTQLLIAELGSSHGAERAVLIEHSLLKLSSLTEKLLQLARADAGIGLSETPHDLIPIIEMVVEDERRHAPGRSIAINYTDGTTLVRPVDPDAFAIALRNLIENAISHGDPLAPVEIEIGVDHRVTISNRARAFSAEELARIRQRLHRADDSTSGSGLGLSIVERLLSHMNASLDLHSRSVGSDSTFEAVIRFA